MPKLKKDLPKEKKELPRQEPMARPARRNEQEDQPQKNAQPTDTGLVLPFRADEDRLTPIFDHVTDAFFCVDSEWRFTYINPRGLEITGKRTQDLLGHTLWELWPRFLGTQTEEFFRKGMKGRAPLSGEFPGIYTDGLYQATIFPMENGLAALLVDKTNESRREKALRESQSQLRDFMESTHDSYFALDRNWLFIYANRRYGELVNRDPQELIGKSFWKEFPKYKKTAVESHYRQVMEERQPVHFEASGSILTAGMRLTRIPSRRESLSFRPTALMRKKRWKACRRARNNIED